MGAGGREFESLHPDRRQYHLSLIKPSVKRGLSFYHIYSYLIKYIPKSDTEKSDTLKTKSINSKVVFIEKYHLTGYDYYASCGKSQVGGWAIKESATLYCSKGYDLSSEKFNISYLKHESLHFIDLNDYPNLSSADLEYRAKVIELMYCTEKSIYRQVAEFINGADSSDRSHSHPYANYILIKNLSQLIFNSEYETDINKWKKLSVEEINSAAISLYNMSEKRLQKDRNVSDII